MKEGIFADEKEYASLPVRQRLKGEISKVFLLFSYKLCPLDGAKKAGQVFLPVLENASKAQNLRVTLGVFERSKFFFNLPTFIIESTEMVGSLYIYTEVEPHSLRQPIGPLRNGFA
jgi:exocyst complex component 2